MGIKLKNNAFSLLAASLAAADTALTVSSGDGSKFPSLGAGDYFYATLLDVNNNFEIVKVTARSGDAMSITRAQEGTLALPFPSGSRIELRITAQTFVDIMNGVLVTEAYDHANLL